MTPVSAADIADGKADDAQAADFNAQSIDSANDRL
jgi:hypothetical protein